MTNKKIKGKKAVFILEDKKQVLDSWVDAIREECMKCGDVYVFGRQTDEGAWSAIERAQRLGYELSVVVVDQVKQDENTTDKTWGFRFLKNIKEKFPHTYRVMFSGQSEREDIQNALDEGLIHDFEAKALQRVPWEPGSKMILKITNFLSGKNIGNVQSPSAKDEFELFMKQWIQKLPDGEDTDLVGLDGKIIKAGQLLKNDGLRDSFHDAFETARFDRMALAARKCGERGKRKMRKQKGEA